MPIKNPATVHPKYSAMELDRYVCRTLMGGTTAMREARTEFLPQEPGEDPADYENRLARSFLYNGFKKTVVSFAGRVFDRPIRLSGSTALEEWAKNITNDGRDLTTLARDLWSTGVAEGMAFILVDYPQNPSPGSLAEERRRGLRPFMREIEPKDLIWWHWVNLDGVPKLVEVRIRESEIGDDGQTIEQIRRIFYERQTDKSYSSTLMFEVYQQGGVDAVGKAVGWQLVQSGTMIGVDKIPLVAIYFNERQGVLQAKPPLRDLADLNIAHWQSYSDQRHILHVARVPVLFGKCLQLKPNEKLVIGVNRSIIATSADADAKYIAAPSEPINAGKDDLVETERRMDAMGVQLMLDRRPGSETATGRAIDKAQEESALQFMAGSLRAGLTDAVRLMNEWDGHPEQEFELVMNSTFDLVSFDASEVEQLSKARERGDISRETWWSEALRRSILRDDFDPEEEKKRLEEEEEEATRRGLEMMRQQQALSTDEEEEEEES